MKFPRAALEQLHRRAEDRKIDLAAMRVARERQCDAVGPRRKEERLVNERIAGASSSSGRIAVGRSAAPAGPPKRPTARRSPSPTARTDGRAGSVGATGSRGQEGTPPPAPADAADWSGGRTGSPRPPVVIAENRVDAERRLETRQLLRPGAGRNVAGDVAMCAHEIAEQHGEIRASRRWRNRRFRRRARPTSTDSTREYRR